LPSDVQDYLKIGRLLHFLAVRYGLQTHGHFEWEVVA
jgi:hypothetical protein